jgi:transcription-repair coupling factor (superfamily II helicase)
VQKNEDLLTLVAESPAIATKLRQIEDQTWPISFSHVIDSAQPFLVAALARKIDKRIWILCPSVRAQELFYESLVNWLPSAHFLPEAEFAAVENILPDPEIAAERLALLAKIEKDIGRHVVVATRASLDQPAPIPGSLQSASISLHRGTSSSMEQLLEKLDAAGYQRISQVNTRGQFAVRGGIVDLYSWQAQLPVRVEFFGDEIESLREFDIDTQTSVRDLASVDILLGAPEEQGGKVRDYISRNHLQLDLEPAENSEAQIQISEGWIEGTTSLRAMQSTNRMRGEPAEEFRGREHNEILLRKTKTSRERAFDQMNAREGAFSDNLAEALDFALSLKIDNDSGVVAPPFV